MMTLPRWVDPKITLGNIFTIAAMVIGFLVWGVKLENRVDSQGEKISKLEVFDVQIFSRVEAARELAAARQEAVLTRLARMEAILERLDKQSGNDFPPRRKLQE